MVVSIIEALHVCDLGHLSEIVDSRYEEELKKKSDSMVGVVAYYEDMKQILINLIEDGYDINSIEICDPSYNSYDDEYLLTILDNGIDVEPLKNEKGKYILYEANVLYVLEDVKHKCLDSAMYDQCYEVDIDDEEEYSLTCNGDCACCDEYCSDEKKVTEQKDNNMHTISFGKVNGDEYSQMTISADNIDLAQMYADKIVDLFYK